MSNVRAVIPWLSARARQLWKQWQAHAERALPDPQLPKSRMGVTLFVIAQFVAFAVFVRTVKPAFKPLLTPPPTPRVPAPTSMTRFGLTEPVRREIFRELADGETSERASAIARNSWNGHLWSRFDDLGYVQRAKARELAQRNNISLSQVYLVLDEGIRERWPASNGQPLPPNAEPLSLRPE